jgi:riboflavin kinase
LRTLCVRGTAFSGKGEGSTFIRVPWVKEQIKEKLGFTPYPGTLNVRLAAADAIKARKLLAKAKSIEIVPTEGFCRGRCFKAHLGGAIQCAVIIPEIAGYPEDVVEVISSMNLRERLHLNDGSKVEVKIMLE